MAPAAVTPVRDATVNELIVLAENPLSVLVPAAGE